MSVCISRDGEYSAHVPNDKFSCDRCHVFDEDAALARIAELEASVRPFGVADREIIAAFFHETFGGIGMQAKQCIHTSELKQCVAWADALLLSGVLVERGVVEATLVDRIAHYVEHSDGYEPHEIARMVRDQFDVSKREGNGQ